MRSIYLLSISDVRGVKSHYHNFVHPNFLVLIFREIVKVIHVLALHSMFLILSVKILYPLTKKFRSCKHFLKKNQHLQDLIRVYKETRNGMIGPDYSTKFSPWLASGSLSPRYVYEEVRVNQLVSVDVLANSEPWRIFFCLICQVKRYEKERLANNSTYW